MRYAILLSVGLVHCAVGALDTNVDPGGGDVVAVPHDVRVDAVPTADVRASDVRNDARDAAVTPTDTRTPVDVVTPPRDVVVQPGMDAAVVVTPDVVVVPPVDVVMPPRDVMVMPPVDVVTPPVDTGTAFHPFPGFTGAPGDLCQIPENCDPSQGANCCGIFPPVCGHWTGPGGLHLLCVPP